MNRQSSLLKIIIAIVTIGTGSITLFAGRVNASPLSNAEAVGAWPTGKVENWVIDPQGSEWSAEELDLVRVTLTTTIMALDEAGYDGQALLAGYSFRRQPGEFIDELDGQIALVRHSSQEVVLSDTAFKRLWGFYLYHELGHIVDKRMDRELSRRFHGLAGSEGNGVTANGYWLNDHARGDQEEATADAFALWVVIGYTNNPRPAFAHTPVDTNYEVIVDTLKMAMAGSV